MRKRRLKKIWVFVLAITVMATLFFSVDKIGTFYKETTIPNYKTLTHIGYSEKQIKIINAQSSEELKTILSADYQSDIVKILSVPHYKTLKDKGYPEADLNLILKSDEAIVVGLTKLPHLTGWNEYLSQPVYRSILDAGYTEAAAKSLLALKGTDIPKILTYGYLAKYDELLNSVYLVPSDLPVYLAYWQTHPKLTVRSLTEIINTENDRADYTGVVTTDLTKGNLILVNKYFRLPSDFVPQNLVTITVCGSATMSSQAANALRSMCTAMISAGLHPRVTSSYRSYGTQAALYSSYVSQDGKAQADTYSARPGFSEHQTGFAVDMITSTSSLSTFKNTAESKWLLAHAQEYGFILRYSQSKQAITGYISEPWHWRYVGVSIAKDFKSKNMTFDEYYRLYIQ
jgi:LAS superfamily LD-carboxypeptidase LdcB